MEIALLSIVVVAAGFVGTLTGFGTSTIMVPVMLLYYPMPQTLLFVGIIHWFGDIWKIVFFKKGFDFKLILCFGIPGIAASYLGAFLVFEINTALLSRLLGGFLILYVVYIYLKPSFKIKENPVTAVIGGTGSGFLAGIFGMGGAVRGLFLSAFNLPKETYIATAGAIALFIDTTRNITYYKQGSRLETLLFWGMLLFIPTSFVGAKLAKMVVNKIPQKYFRIVVVTFLFLIGLKLLIFPK